MAKNFKIADIKNDSLYTVSLIDKWDGTSESKTMSGDELKSFTNAAAHLYDIHAIEIEKLEKEEEENKMRKYELTPTDGRKSFYGKAVVIVADNGTETLYSYGTPIIKRLVSGELVKLWNDWTATTGRHIKAFCGLSKAEYMSL